MNTDNNKTEEFDKEVEARLLCMMKEKPAKLLMYFLHILGNEMVEANASYLDLSQEMTINDKRYKVTCKSTIKKVKIAKNKNSHEYRSLAIEARRNKGRKN